MEDVQLYDPQGKPIWGSKMGKVQKPYHLQTYQIDTLNEIRRCLKANKYSDQQMIRDHLDVLSAILGKISWAVNNEGEAGYDNISTKNDIEEIKHIYYQLKSMLYA